MTIKFKYYWYETKIWFTNNRVWFYWRTAEEIVKYYEERIPELSVLDGNKFNEDFVEVLRHKTSYRIEEDIELICN